MRLSFVCIVFMSYSCMNVGEYANKLLQKSVEEKYLSAHNQIRQAAGSQPLVWDQELQETSKRQADDMAKGCNTSALPIFDTNNVYQSWGNLITSPKDVVKYWARDSKKYRKLVSKNTIAVGCGYAICNDPSTLSNSVIHVCNYKEKSILDRILQ